ncbi:uncharacterized protein LOC130440638 [Diorhabda sublineata]|uniref:uncharacterized protein LOC130440638 n=1 Tax=Diorhabda sublineata TaxID=1163346 RepID=UPI0024E105E5|nr:uncharacterized protein LOC130440638 [Diorhabda sublineata]
MSKNIIRVATWIRTSFNNKDQEILCEISIKSIDLRVCAIQETKIKGKVHRNYNMYTLIYSGVNKEERARSGVGILLHKKCKEHIESRQYVSERIECVKITTDRKKLNVLSIYSPEDCKIHNERENFVE